MSNPSQGIGGTRDHTSLLNRNVVGQHSSESAGVLSPSSINPNDIGRSWRSLGIIAPNIVRGASYLGNGIAIFGDNDGRIWRSTDFGATWANIGIVSHFAGQPIFTIAYLGNGIVISSDFSGFVHRSTDFGVTWADLGDVTGTNTTLLASAFIGSSTAFGQGVVLLGDVNGHIWFSGNNGVTWADAGGFSAGFIDSITYLDNNIVIFTDNQGHIFRSTNGGTAWTDLGDFSTSSMLGSVYLGNGAALASDGLGHIFRSTNFGLNWTDLGVQSNGGSSIQALSYLGNGAVVFGDFNGHVFNSLDYGLTWTDNPSGAISGTVIRTIAYLSSGVVILGDNNGTIFRSSTSFKTDEARATVLDDLLDRRSELVGVLSPSSMNHNDIGGTVGATNGNWAITTAYGTAISCTENIGSGIVLAGTGTGHILRSTDHGKLFTDFVTLVATPINTIVYLGNGLVLAGDNQPTAHLYQSTDYGISWIDTGSPLFISNPPGIVCLTYVGHGTVIFGTPNGRMWFSTDFGATWQWQTPSVNVGGIAVNTISYLDNGIVVVGYNNGRICRNTGFGLAGFWTDLGVIGTGISSSAYLGNGIVIMGDNNGRIYRSTNFGLTWADLGIIDGLNNIVITMAYLGNGIAIAGIVSGAAGRIYKSTDYGLTWTNLTPGAFVSGTFFRSDTAKYLGNGVSLIADNIGNILRNDIGSMSHINEEFIQDIPKRIRTITSLETLDKDDYTILADVSGGGFTISLPSTAASGAGLGHVFNIKKIDGSANSVTIDAAGSQTIDGALTYLLNVQYQTVTIQSDGSNWYII